MEEKDLKSRLAGFVDGLSESEARSELVLAYLQMERCRQVLKGENVRPVEMRDNGDSTDLELFYQCRKAAEELGYLGDDEEDGDYDEDGDYIEITFSGKSVDEVIGKLSEYVTGKPSDGKDAGESGKSRYSAGDRIWYMYGDMIQHSTVKTVMRDSDGAVIYGTGLGHNTAESETFNSLDGLINSLIGNIKKDGHE